MTPANKLRTVIGRNQVITKFRGNNV